MTAAKAQPGETIETTSDDLPEGWATTSIGELCDIRSGDFIRRAEYAKKTTGAYPVVGAGGPLGSTDRYNAEAPVMTLGRVGAAGALNVSSTRSWVTDNALIIDPVLPGFFDWLALFFRTVRWTDIQTGSTQPLITQTLVNSLDLPFAPLLEQHRIVAKIDELLKRVNTSRVHLAKVPKILKAFRQSVLAVACSGRLTEDWRERQNGRPLDPR